MKILRVKYNVIEIVVYYPINVTQIKLKFKEIFDMKYIIKFLTKFDESQQRIAREGVGTSFYRV